MSLSLSAVHPVSDDFKDISLLATFLATVAALHSNQRWLSHLFHNLYVRKTQREREREGGRLLIW